MGILDKYQTLIIFAAIPLGLLIGQIGIIEQYAENL
jgi:hypothetical protein